MLPIASPWVDDTKTLRRTPRRFFARPGEARRYTCSGRNAAWKRVDWVTAIVFGSVTLYDSNTDLAARGCDYYSIEVRAPIVAEVSCEVGGTSNAQ
jgi:hypothetical protein